MVVLRICAVRLFVGLSEQKNGERRLLHRLLPTSMTQKIFARDIQDGDRFNIANGLLVTFLRVSTSGAERLYLALLGMKCWEVFPESIWYMVASARTGALETVNV